MANSGGYPHCERCESFQFKVVGELGAAPVDSFVFDRDCQKEGGHKRADTQVTRDFFIQFGQQRLLRKENSSRKIVKTNNYINSHNNTDRIPRWIKDNCEINKNTNNNDYNADKKKDDHDVGNDDNKNYIDTINESNDTNKLITVRLGLSKK